MTALPISILDSSIASDRPAVAPRPALVEPTLAPAAPESALLGVYKRAPVHFVRGEGVRLYDDAGKAYVDFTSGIAVNALGYADAELQAVMTEAAQGLVHLSNLYSNTPAERLAQSLVSRSFASKVFLCNSGAEANEGAFKFARRWARSVGGGAKHEIVSLRGAFHGRLFGTLAATDRPAYRMPFRPLAPGIDVVERDLEALAQRVTPETTAAIVVEPIQGEGGVRVLDHGFLRELRAVATEKRVALIFDEIQCGLGRTGTFFAYEQSGVEPDLLTLAKPIAGGLPMGAVLLSAEIAATLQPGDHGTTFGGGPFVSAVAHHVVERLAQPALLDHVTETGAWLGEALHGIAERTGRVRAVRGQGFMWGIDTMTKAGEIVSRALSRGLLVLTAGDHTLRLLPPLVATKADLAQGLAILEDALGCDPA